MHDRARLYNHNQSYCPCGSGERDRYVKDLSEIPPRLKKVGTTNQQALIQSYADECDVNRIVARYEAGDISVLGRVQGIYADVTGYPDNSIEALNLGNTVKSLWDNLSLEEQAKYGSQEAFVNALVSSLDNPVPPRTADHAPNEGISDEGGKTE